MEKILSSKVSIITGGATGIGKDIALTFSKHGSKVILLYNKSFKSAKQIKSNILKHGNDCDIYKVDFDKKTNFKKLFYKIKKKYGKIDILVNNAGYLNQINYSRISLKEWNRNFNINLTSVFFASQAISEIFKKQKSGNIINISSIGAQIGGTRAPHYAAAKLGVISLTKSFAKLLAIHNVRVNAIAPGIIKTKMINQFINKIGKKNINKSIPLGHIGEVQDISNTAVFLGSEMSNYITGQVININGGSYLG